MPNFDGGHYFLSSLVPILEGLDSRTKQNEGNSESHIHAIREILSILPPAGEAGSASPFSRELSTHFCRMVVIEDLTFVGREHEDAIVSAIRKINPVIPKPVDHLPFPYLAVIVDFDAADGSAESLKAYLQRLWAAMAPELEEIFQHCQGFDPASPKESFIRQVIQGQIETTMSFNDYYWQGEPGYWQGSPSLATRWGKVVILPLGVAGIAVLVLALAGFSGWVLIGLVGLIGVLTLLWLIQRLFQVGMEPFPTAPRTELRSILKALYLQRKFIDFMIQNQGCDAATLSHNFADFLTQHQPQSIESPTQLPGCIPS
jgi:hypothetical protein